MRLTNIGKGKLCKVVSQIINWNMQIYLDEIFLSKNNQLHFGVVHHPLFNKRMQKEVSNITLFINYTPS